MILTVFTGRLPWAVSSNLAIVTRISKPHLTGAVPITLNIKYVILLFLISRIFRICSFIALDLLFDDILGLKFFAIVLDHCTPIINNFMGFLCQSFLQTPAHSPSVLLSLFLIGLVWCSTKGLPPT